MEVRRTAYKAPRGFYSWQLAVGRRKLRLLILS